MKGLVSRSARPLAFSTKPAKMLGGEIFDENHIFFIYTVKGKKFILNKQIFCYGLMCIRQFMLGNSL